MVKSAAYAHSKYEHAIKYHYYPEKPLLVTFLLQSGWILLTGMVTLCFIDVTDMVNRMKEEYEQV